MGPKYIVVVRLAPLRYHHPCFAFNLTTGEEINFLVKAIPEIFSAKTTLIIKRGIVESKLWIIASSMPSISSSPGETPHMHLGGV